MDVKKICYHCGLDIPSEINYTVNINNTTRHMCCLGCLVISKFIIDNDFEDYYLHRNNFNQKVDFNILHENEIYDKEEYQLKFLKKKDGFEYLVLAIDGITCAACTWLIENYLKKIDGMIKVSVNLVTCRAHIVFDLSLLKVSFILNELLKIGYKAYPYIYKKTEKNNKLEYKKELKKLIVAGLGMSQVMMLSASLYVGEGKDLHFLYWNFIRWINFVIATPVLFYSGWSILIKALNNLKLKTFGMDFTISLSLVLAYFSSLFNLINKNGDVYFDSVCMFVFFLLVSRFLEMRARHHSSNIIYSLQELTSGYVNILEKDVLKKVSIDEIKINDIILINPGDVVPVDGFIIDGYSDFDESMLTGESKPVFKKINYEVVGGITNLSNPVYIKVVKNKNDSKLNLIIDILENAISFKNNSYFFYDKIANFFTFFVIILTLNVSFFWFYFTDENIINITLSMLAITCPCALSLAVPIALVSSMNFLAKYGFLITNSNVLNKLNSITDIIFDKTGTLTSNVFFLEKVKLNKDVSLHYVLSIANILEKHSNHPVSKAFNLNIAFSKNIISNIHVNNNGVEGLIDKTYYRIGNISFIQYWVDTFLDIKCDDFYVILADKKNILAWFKIKNPLRDNLLKIIFCLKKCNINMHIISGDIQKRVALLAEKLILSNFLGDASFLQKIEYIKKLKIYDSRILMVGDGINDAPAMSIADISISMGSGVDLAKINSDVILLNNDLNLIPKAIFHSKKLSKIINQNIFWAIFYNAMGLFLASLNLISPYYAAIGMSISSLFVVLNSLRLNKI